MDPQLARYAPGGDIHARLANNYGPGWADRAYQFAKEGDQTRLNALLSDLRREVERPGQPDLPDSTLGQFGRQIVADPLGAPLDSFNRGASKLLLNTVEAIGRNPWVLLALAAFLFIQFPAARRAVFGK